MICPVVTIELLLSLFYELISFLNFLPFSNVILGAVVGS